MRLFLLIPASLIMGSCSTSLQSESDSTYTLKTTVSDYEKTLVINEYAPKSVQLNEYGEKADWIELYNTSDSDLFIASGEWSLTDDRSEPVKYSLPETTIKAHTYVLIWCDNNPNSKEHFHAPFKLSPNGEELLLYRNGEIADVISYDDQVKKGRSYGRKNDGASLWQKFDNPSPGSNNNSSNDYAESLK